MAKPKIFLSYAAPGRSYDDWKGSLVASLQRRGVQVVDERETLDGTPLDQADETLREGPRSSDLVVFLLDGSNVASPTFLFEYGASAVLAKPSVAVLAEGMEPDALPVHELRAGAIPKGAAEDTANQLDHLLHARLTA